MSMSLPSSKSNPSLKLSPKSNPNGVALPAVSNMIPAASRETLFLIRDRTWTLIISNSLLLITNTIYNKSTKTSYWVASR